MSKENIAKEIAKEVYQKWCTDKKELEQLILDKLTEILHHDKGVLHEGTITSDTLN